MIVVASGWQWVVRPAAATQRLPLPAAGCVLGGLEVAMEVHRGDALLCVM